MLAPSDRLAEIEELINEKVAGLYGIPLSDSSAVHQIAISSPDSVSIDASVEDECDEEMDGVAGIELNAPANTLYSWLIGVAFGRFDARLATGERAVPAEPDPFAPLSCCSPGMWPEGEPRKEAPPAILVEDQGHRHDIVTHAARVAENTGCSVGEDFRHWTAGEFFSLHLKMYTKSGRKAPIYWQLATAS